MVTYIQTETEMWADEATQNEIALQSAVSAAQAFNGFATTVLEIQTKLDAAIIKMEVEKTHALSAITVWRASALMSIDRAKSEAIAAILATNSDGSRAGGSPVDTVAITDRNPYSTKPQRTID
jgi:hypothetical protein